MKQSHTKTSAEIVAPKSEDFFEMANLSPKRTELPFVVWISPKAGPPHDVRLKVSKAHSECVVRVRKRGPEVHPSELISVAMRPDVHVVGGGDLSAQDLALLKQWIDLNPDVIVKYWDGEIEYTEDAIARLRPIHDRKA
jgi:hypothetical protein